MASIRIRPKVREFSYQSEEILIDNFKNILGSDQYPFDSKVVKHHIFVTFKKTESHFWSPELSLEVVKNYLQDDEYTDQKEPTLLRGYISPSPSVWVMFLFTYAVIGLACLGFLVWGTSQMMLGQPTLMLWYALGCVGLCGVVFFATQIGQRIAEDQTDLLMKFVTQGLEGN